jgi:hypothetical protein
MVGYLTPARCCVLLSIGTGPPPPSTKASASRPPGAGGAGGQRGNLPRPPRAPWHGAGRHAGARRLPPLPTVGGGLCPCLPSAPPAAGRWSRWSRPAARAPLSSVCTCCGSSLRLLAAVPGRRSWLRFLAEVPGRRSWPTPAAGRAIRPSVGDHQDHLDRCSRWGVAALPTVRTAPGRAQVRVHEAKDGQRRPKTAKDGQEDLMWALVASIISWTARRCGRRRASRKTTPVVAALEVTR